MNVKRLEMLIRVLKEVPNSLIDLENWVSSTTPANSISDNINCGTVACIVGWACFDKEFQKEGLSYDVETEAPKYVEAGQTYESWIAISKFFGLTHEQANYLFSNDEYQEAKPIKREALKRISELLNTI